MTEASPQPQSPPKDDRTPRNHERPTSASMSKSSPPALGPPKSVEELAKMTPMERVKYEAAQKKAANERKRSGSPAFAQPSSRSSVSPQRQRREKQEEERLSKIMQTSKSPRKDLPSYNEVKREPASSSWAKSKLPRMTYQFPWSKMPQAVPQKSLVGATPGPGAYGSSTSFLTS